MSAPSEDGFERAIQTTAGEAKTLAWKISLILRGLRDVDPEFSVRLQEEIVAILAPESGPRSQLAALVNARPHIVANMPSPSEPLRERVPEIELSIMDIIKEHASGMNLSAIHERLQDLNEDSISKASLSVRLHRMVKGGRLTSPARGFYELPGSGLRLKSGDAVGDLRSRR